MANYRKSIRVPKRIKPVGDRVLVRLEEAKEYNTFLQLPDRREENIPTIGTILELGNGKKLRQEPLSVGDRIVIAKYGGRQFIDNLDQSVALVDLDNIFAIL